MTVALHDLPEVFRRAIEPIEIVNENGLVVGRYHPSFPVTPEYRAELERRRKEPRTGRTTADVISRLEREQGEVTQ